MQQQAFVVEIDLPEGHEPVPAHVLLHHLTTQTSLSRRISEVRVKMRHDTSLSCAECERQLEELREDNACMCRLLAEPPEFQGALERARMALEEVRHPMAWELPDWATTTAMLRRFLARARAEEHADGVRGK